MEEVAFTRAARPGQRDRRAGRCPRARAPRLGDGGAGADPAAPHLVFDWRPEGTPDALDGAVARLRDVVSGEVSGALCPHGGGPPRCWCRPPLPGLALAFAATHDVDLTRSVVVGSGPAHRTLANALGARHVPVVA